MHKVIEKLRSVAPTDSTVLILGENGTGKEIAARAIHQNSDRKSKPFVPLNISALPESILESELFGHEAGAYTGAATKRIGKFEFANGGTLFLDEVGEMPAPTQVKLLRVLEDRRITRLGSNDEIEINVRLIAATNADLQELVKKGSFRKDLYYRLSVVSIFLPPLSERRGDIPLLVEHFLKQLGARENRPLPSVTKQAMHALMAYNWPGNIRELRNAVERMVVLDTDGRLDVDDLPEEIAPLSESLDEAALNASRNGTDLLIGRPLNDVEKFYIERALELSGGRREEAATMLGIGERTLYRKIKEYDIKA
jgi:two-component system response regulator HydG